MLIAAAVLGHQHPNISEAQRESNLCKSVDYSSSRRRVKKHHGNSHDVIQQPGVEDAGRVDRGVGHEQSADENEQSLWGKADTLEILGVESYGHC